MLQLKRQEDGQGASEAEHGQSEGESQPPPSEVAEPSKRQTADHHAHHEYALDIYPSVICIVSIKDNFNLLTHSCLTEKQFFPGFFISFFFIFPFLRPEHDCYAKFTSCST